MIKTDDYLKGINFRLRHKLETRQTGKWIRAWILFLESEMKTDYYACRIGWGWMFR